MSSTDSNVAYGKAAPDIIEKFSLTIRDREVFKNLKVDLQDIQDDNYDYSKVVYHSRRPKVDC